MDHKQKRSPFSILFSLTFLVWVVEVKAHNLCDTALSEQFKVTYAQKFSTSETLQGWTLNQPTPQKTSKDIVSEYRKHHKIYISMTTSPKRLSKIGSVIQTLDLSIVDALFLNLPEKFGRDGSFYDESTITELAHTFPKLKVNRFSKDLGPISKILPAAIQIEDPNAVIVSIDDDHTYPRHIIVEIAAKVIKYDSAISGSGQNSLFWGIDLECDRLTGDVLT